MHYDLEFCGGENLQVRANRVFSGDCDIGQKTGYLLLNGSFSGSLIVSRKQGAHVLSG
ncbi:MAG: hypothetical protein QF632_01625 [Candidatus Woesearchaeota archaeon]|jgi:hypothetical protein|nr:hypothetical protein [Candidatus Woesearchaeota archaeon]MDP7323442.1 hypothetical protein [Candidatus Woesearchaeota archaeon]MDP7458252.1 hypothetical protein [Candidatus Woesearchaeota archaeon]